MRSPQTEELRHRTRQILDVLLAPHEPQERLRAAVGELEELLCGIHGVRSARVDESARYRLQSKHGQVISPGYAVSTMQDALRTAKYLRALVSAIEAAQRRRPGQRVHVLYAGPGPNAPFFILPCLCFDPTQVGFTLVEILPANCEAERKLIAAFQLEPYVHDVVLADAAEYVHRGQPYQVVVLEIMQRALEVEPQVAVSANLVGQMAEEGVLVPQKVELRAALCDVSAELSHRRTGKPPETALRARRELGTVFSLTKDSCRELYAIGLSSAPACTIRMPAELDSADQLTILTDITLYDSIRLEEGESGLAGPAYLLAFGRVKPRQEVSMQYALGPTPGLRCTVVQERPRVSTGP